MKNYDEKSAFVITLPPPTPNGGLHLGHLSGPFIGADIFAKSLELKSVPFYSTSYSDKSQSYVRVTAQRQGVDPDELSQKWTNDIIETLERYNFSLDEYFNIDATSEAFVQSLFHKLYEQGVLVKKSMPFFRSLKTNELLDEAGITGFCPECLSSSNCGICESCSVSNDPNTILFPRESLTNNTDLSVEYVDVLTIDLEKHRDRLVNFYNSNRVYRPKYKWLVERILEKPLGYFPISVPGTWGINVGLPEFTNQVFNAWPEIMAQQVFSYKNALQRNSELDRENLKFVNFYGFDNTYFYAIVHVILLSIIEDGEWLPYGAMTNEFYNLESKKFSTSKNHVIWSKDILDRYTPDEVRFYAALNNPGFEKANFSEDVMNNILDDNLISKWSLLAQLFNTNLAKEVSSGLVCDDIADVLEDYSNRIFASYSFEKFNLRQVAEDLTHILDFTTYLLQNEKINSLESLQLIKLFAKLAYPIMPSFSTNFTRSINEQKFKEKPNLSTDMKTFLTPKETG